jgi:hypothetical protein
MNARCSINILNVQPRIGILRMSTGAEMVGAMKMFEREIGEEKIVCQMQSFIMISAQHWVR